MLGKTIICTLADRDQWTEKLGKLPICCQDIYYTPEYYEVYQNYGDGLAVCFIYELNDHLALYPFFKNSVNALGYSLDNDCYDIQGVYGYNGMISNSNDPHFLSLFFRAFNEYCIESKIIAEFTRFNPLQKNHELSINNMKVVEDRKTVVLDLLQGYEEIWLKSYSSNNRNMIRKAQKNNVVITQSNHKNDYIEFYNVYKSTMDNVGSDPYLYFDESYMLDINSILKENHELILAKHEGKIIGGMILLIYKDYAHYHLSARNVDYGKFALNNLLLDYAIKRSIEMNCKKMHFGGGLTSDTKDPLLKFKSNFSKEKADFYIGKKIHALDLYNTVVDIWGSNNDDKKEEYKNIILKYRK